MIILTTMKSVKHEILKEQWKELIKRYNESGLPVKQWCEENQIPSGRYYYWLRAIREESLIKAGTMAVTGQTQFAEINTVEICPSAKKPQFNNQEIRAILRSNGNEIEILNGADPNTLESVLRIIVKS